MSQISLCGDWLLSSPAHPQIEVKQQIPGDNFSALIDAGVIPDPYFATNEKDVQWVGESEWRIEREFDITAQQMLHEGLWLTLARVDTVATVRVNGTVVLVCQNMFRIYRVDLKQNLVVGRNHISIDFESAALVAQSAAKKEPFSIPWSEGNNQVPHMNLLRKVQCHAGWDWGVCLLVSGVYDAITITPLSTPRLELVSCDQKWSEDGSVEVKIRVEHEPIDNQTLYFEWNGQVHECIANGTQSVWSLIISEPKLWWPRGYGEQTLNELVVRFGDQSITKRIGLRQLDVDLSVDPVGSAMTIMVNTLPITAKGANWIPSDALPGRQTPYKYKTLLRDAADANMNMIRVWGGGQYESDEFYDQCDELGLLVWQDMMFACALYPSHERFVEEVAYELRDQIRRLKHHACIALWCGDNEVIGAINWYPESRQNREKYVVNYDRLNREIERVIKEQDPTRLFWPSSPCNGELDYGDAWHDDNKGDMHFWDVWHSGKSFDAYHEVIPRFCSEFGYQSWPSFAEVKSFVPQEDWNITSPTFETHQKNARGNSIITEMFTRYFLFPSGFEQMLYLSQVQQALAIKTACEYWRANKPRCRGMLYWQLNDCWPVSSWSSIEYSGRWKQLHYHVKRFFSSLYVPCVKEENGLSVRLNNDGHQGKPVEVTVRWLDWQGMDINRWEFDTFASADANEVLLTISNEQLHQHRGQGFLHILCKSSHEEVENVWFDSGFKQLPIKRAEIRFEVNRNKVTLSTDIPAFFVHLECDAAGRFSDSSFTLLPGENREIDYIGDEADVMRESLRIYQLGQ